METPGFIYDLALRDAAGKLLQRESCHNLMPTEGINYLLGVSMCDAAKWPKVYMGLFTGDYAPSPIETAAGISANAGEFTDYTGTFRPEVMFDAAQISGGALTNDHAKTVFTFTADGTIKGAFLVTSSNKGGGGGVLLSVARFPSPIPGESGRTLTVRAGILIVNANP